MPKRKPKTAADYLALSVCGNCRHWQRLDDKDQIPAEDLLGEVSLEFLRKKYA